MKRPKDNKSAKFKEWKGEKYSFEKGEIFWRNCFGAESRPLTLGSPHDSLIKMSTSETRWWWSSWKWWWWYVSWSHGDDDDGGFLKSLIWHWRWIMMNCDEDHEADFDDDCIAVGMAKSVLVNIGWSPKQSSLIISRLIYRYECKCWGFVL